MALALQLLALALHLCKLHREQLWVGAVYLIRIFSCNSLLLCSAHTSSPNHICTNELLCHVQPITGNCCKTRSRNLWHLNVKIRCNITHHVQSHSHRVWILEPRLFSFSHSTILCEPKPQEYSRVCPTVCVCLLRTTAHCSYIHLC